jgi:cytoplasmic iron level regulating protein YaaA (DUF328/UPF0246 family)
VLILLPPSEGKFSPERGRKLNLKTLFGASHLTGIRQNVLDSHPEIDPSICLPAHEIYTGVLYQALGWDSLSPTARKRGSESILIISALMGAVRIDDHIPSYKLKMKSALWKDQLSELCNGLNHNLIIDCRSSTYSGVWNPPHEKTVAVRVFQIKDGKKSVITHMSKKYRGEIVRLLLQGKSPASPQEAYERVSRQFNCQLSRFTEKEPWILDLLIEV